ncbi:MAG: nuclear transport factor 2 family protein [Planctomycetes bacterium]|nr:nuclear transport factor 2 family protein [Planctomycetota bacterium]
MKQTFTLLCLGTLLSCCAVPDGSEHHVQRLMGMWESGNLHGLEEFTTEDVIYDDVANGAQFVGRDGVSRYISHIHAWAGQVEITVTKVHSGADFAVAEWVLRGVQDRPIPGRLPVATDQPFQMNGATIVELRDGKIASERLCIGRPPTRDD